MTKKEFTEDDVQAYKQRVQSCIDLLMESLTLNQVTDFVAVNAIMNIVFNTFIHHKVPDIHIQTLIKGLNGAMSCIDPTCEWVEATNEK